MIPLGHVWRSAATALLGLALVLPARGANRTWVGMNNDWDASTGNWSPADEPDADDAAIFNSSVSVDLANANESINGLTMSGGADLDLNGNDMTVDGLASLSGASTNLFVGPTGSVLTADAITINSGAALALRGGTVTINEESGDGLLDLNAGGTVSGHGIISFTDAVAAGTKLFINDGALTATSTAIDVGGSTAATLTIGASDTDARVDLDGAGDAGTVTVARNDTLDIDVRLSDQFNGTMVLNAGATLDIASAWGMIAGDINADTVGISPGTAGAMATIAGGAFTQNGGSINLDAIDTLRIASHYNAFGGAININGGTFIMDGGGAINAGVIVSLQNGATFQGFGEINVEFNVASDGVFEFVLADNGTLELNGDPNNAIVGTADDDGVLFVPHAWSTIDAAFVNLNGGELRGGDITNDASFGIRGFGLLSARVINDSEINARDGGTLVVATAGNNNDWDGAANDGELFATTGSLELRDTSSHVFSGQVDVFAGQEVFTNGFAFLFQTASSINLQGGGRYRSTHTTLFGGALQVGAGQATLQIDDRAEFSSLSQTTLNGDLILDNELTVVESGAEFTGGGAVINAAGRTLKLLDGITSADLAVTIVNDGTLEIDEQVFMDHTPGQAQGVDYEQTSIGVWEVDLGGVGLTAFDRLTLAGAAVLDGTLELSLVDGFVPAIGNTFNVLSAAGGMNGMFAALVQPAGMPAGLTFSVVYNPTLVQLQVVSAPTFSADFDLDGDVDAADLSQWQGDFGVNALSDADDDGDSDGADFLAWQQQVGSVPAAPAAGAVPEPGSLPVLLATACLAFQVDRRRR